VWGDHRALRWPFQLCLETGNIGDPVREVSKDFGRELKRRRVAAGLSLRDLSVRVHYSRGHLSKVENSQVVASGHLVRLSDAALDAGGDLIAFATVPPEGKRDPVGSVTTADWLLSVHANAPRPSGFGVSSLSDISPVQAELTVQAFRNLFDEIRILCRSVNPWIVLPGLRDHACTMRELAVAARAKTRDAAFMLAARYAELVGWMAQEAGDDEAALWWTERASDLAHAGGDRTMGAYAYIRRALIALYHGDPLQTIELARRAQAQPGAPALLKGLAALREAQGQAAVGGAVACRRSLERANECLERADRVKSAPPEFGSTALTDPVGMMAAWCLYDLGKATESAAAFDVQIALVSVEARRARTRFAVRQALAYAAAGEVDHACALTWQLLPDISDVASATIRLDLRQLARVFRRWHSYAPVRDLQPDLDYLLRS
jgi:transcriptional regulator with XRE-family HTH domain